MGLNISEIAVSIYIMKPKGEMKVVLWPILLGTKCMIVWSALDQCIEMEVQRR